MFNLREITITYSQFWTSASIILRSRIFELQHLKMHSTQVQKLDLEKAK